MADDDRNIDAPGPDGPRTAAPVVQLGAPGRGPFVLAALTAIFLAVAIAKPWPTGAGPSVDLVPPSPTATPTVTADPLAIVHRECQDPPGWRTYTKERWSGGTLHVWTTVEPAAGHHAPIEDGLPTVPYATEILGLGFCAPASSADRPPGGAAVHVWRVDEDRAGVSIPRAELLVVAPAVPGLDLPYGALFGPPGPDVGRGTDRWPSARYVFQVEGPGDGYERWWAVQVDPPLHPHPSVTAPPDVQPVP